VERETDLRNLQEEEVDCSELSPSGKRRLVAAMRLMHHQASQVQESPPSSSPWRIDNGSTPLPSVAISEIPPLPTSAPPVSPAIFHYSDLEETNLEETDQFPPEPEPVPEYQSQTPNIRRGKCASLRLKGSSPSASNHSPSMDTSIADTSTDQSFPEISPSDISDMEKSDIGRGSESSIYVTPTPDTAKLSSTSPIAVAMAAAVTPMWSRQQEEGQLQETGPGIAVAQKDHEEHGSEEEEEDVSDSDGNFVGPVVLTTNVGHTFPLLESADTSNKCNESEHQSVEQDGTAETTDYERAAAETMGTSNIRGLGPGKTAMPRMGTCENKKDDGNISDSDISDTESADGSDGINTPDSVKANKGRPSKPSACPGWAVAWSNTHSEWYWWDLKTRETSWNNPRHRVQSSSSVILRTASGKRVHVEDVRMISEDGGTSAVKQVVDKAGVHYALKVMRKTDVHWENVLNEKQVMVDLHMENHPFLVGLVATGKDAENLYMLLQLSKGGDLYQLLEEQEKFAPSDAMFFIAQIILALQTLHDGPPRILMEQNGSHEESYIHRDIKPENVLVGADGYCILADFGFTCRLKRGARTYTKCGTTEYMAPELILGQGYDCAADFWSLGIMLYELLVGYTPFSGNMENDSNSGDKGVHARILAYADGAALGWPAEDKGGEHVPAQSPIRQLILGLLARKPENRLGVSKAGHAGYESLFKHEWFTNVDFGWSQLKKKEIESRFVSEAWEPIITPGDSGTRDDSSGTSDSESDELVRSRLGNYSAQSARQCHPDRVLRLQGDNDGECADDWRYQDF
jgi:serine/threonine protein kinase